MTFREIGEPPQEHPNRVIRWLDNNLGLAALIFLGAMLIPVIASACSGEGVQAECEKTYDRAVEVTEHDLYPYLAAADPSSVAGFEAVVQRGRPAFIRSCSENTIEQVRAVRNLVESALLLLNEMSR